MGNSWEKGSSLGTPAISVNFLVPLQKLWVMWSYLLDLSMPRTPIFERRAITSYFLTR